MELEDKYHNLLSVDRSSFESKPIFKGKPVDLHADVNFYVSDQLIAMPFPSSQGLNHKVHQRQLCGEE